MSEREWIEFSMPHCDVLTQLLTQKPSKMKKTCLFLVFAIALVSCSMESEDAPNDLLVGTWADSGAMEDENLSQSLIYRFNPDKSFTISRVIINSSTTEIVGYRYFSSGTYSINENRILLNQAEIYTLDNLIGDYADLNDLELSGNTDQVNVEFNLDNHSQTLIFEYEPCEPHQNCITSQSFKRLE